MNLDAILALSIEYLSDYFFVFISTLRTPSLRFKPVLEETHPSQLIKPLQPSYLGPKLNPKLFGFMVMSVFIGTTINSLLTPQNASSPIVQTIVVTFIIWFTYSLMVYAICRILFRGKVLFWEIISVTLQLLAVIYVISNVLTFFWSLISRGLSVDGITAGGLNLFIADPILVYYPIHLTLMLLYLPRALQGLYHISWGRALWVGIIPILWVIFAMNTNWALLKHLPIAAREQQNNSVETIIIYYSDRSSFQSFEELLLYLGVSQQLRERKIIHMDSGLETAATVSMLILIALIMLSATIVRRNSALRSPPSINHG